MMCAHDGLLFIIFQVAIREQLCLALLLQRPNCLSLRQAVNNVRKVLKKLRRETRKESQSAELKF